jgi:hypothetical protein
VRHLHAHLALKEAALAKLKPYERSKQTRFRPKDRLLAFLEDVAAKARELGLPFRRP